MNARHAAVPGEKHGFPEAGIYHDFAHVLSGCPTTSEGEIQDAAFIAGFKKENPPAARRSPPRAERAAALSPPR